MSADSDPVHNARLLERAEAEEARSEAARLREQLRLAEEKLALANSTASQPADARKVLRQRVGYFVQQEEVFEVLDRPITSPNIDLPREQHSGAYTQSVAPGVDKLSVTAPPAVQLKRPTKLAPVPAAALVERSSSMRADESCWRVRHVRCDNDKMPTALRPSPGGKEPPLKDVIVEPNEEVLVLDSKAEPKDPNVVWTRVSCAKGEGWMKRMHLKEGGWRMRHMRTDNVNIPTALRERPTATAQPLQAVKTVAHEEVLVHVQLEVLEGGRPTTWARIACKLGEGWLKREHLREVLPPGVKIEELPDDTSETRSAAAPSSNSFETRCDSPRLPPPSVAGYPSATLPVTMQSGVMSCTSPMDSRSSPLASRLSPMESKTSTVLGDAIETCSEYPASGVRIRLGLLDFISNSVGSAGMFDTVSYRAVIQLHRADAEDSAQPRWLDNGQHTAPQTMKYGRSISEQGRYESKICCQFDEALELPWPPADRAVDKIAVDIWMERTTVVDHFDRVLGNLGLHVPAGIDRRWLGRALADLPPEGVDDDPFAWGVEGSGADTCPVPNTMSIGVEWVYDSVEQI